VPNADRDRFSYWMVNGVPQPRGRWALSLTADRSLEIAAVWK
jgi:hypothetical protein